jgi:exopolysaccharide production protein ExoY
MITLDEPQQVAADPIQSVRLPRWKRVLDVVLCAAALPVLGPLTLLMAIVTKFFAPGPVFFKQERIGHQGRRFLCLKFRTMHAGADVTVHQQHLQQLIQSGAPMTKIDAKGDRRLIPGGWLLRATGLDELPQILNVLFGDMSLVGPRPCIPYEFEQFLPWQKQRCATLPGLTGLWQVSGKNRLSFEKMIRLDIQYGQNLSFWEDVRIIAMTIPALVIQVLDQRAEKRRRPAVERPVATSFRLQSPAR